MKNHNSAKNPLDIAIVGGGISGVYSAYRLINGRPKTPGNPEKKLAKDQPKIEIFERENRIGGRLLSMTPPGMPKTRCELGGMRFTDQQVLASNLINHFGLKFVPQEVFQPENIAYLRGRHIRKQDSLDPLKIPYRMNWAEQSIPTNELTLYAMSQIVPGLKEKHGEELDQLLQNTTFEGKPLYQYGFWNLLERTLSREAYAFITESGGYDSATGNYNAVDTIKLNFDFVPGVKFHMLKDGFESLPIKIAEAFEKDGGNIHMGWTMSHFDMVELEDGSHGVCLYFYPTGGDDDDLTKVYARNMVLAIPRRSLELIESKNAFFEDETLQALIKTVDPVPLFKIFVAYNYPWWRTKEGALKTGRSTTDLPVRQCYYWSVENEQEGADPNNQHSVLLGSYDDDRSVRYWQGFEDKAAGQPLYEVQKELMDTDHELDEFELSKWEDHKATKSMIAEIHRQLVELHGQKTAPKPYAAAYKNWSEDPYGGGVNFWKIHVKSWEVMPKMVHPVEKLPVFVIGEAYSRVQGWVEGALQTSELLLQDHFKLDPPAWVPEGE
jgi:monoamine oxidase